MHVDIPRLANHLNNVENILKGQSHKKLCEIMIWDVSFGLI
jgi:hypothetical protein